MATRKTTSTKTTAKTTTRKPAAKKTAGNSSPARSKLAMTLTHDQIAAKAYEIWVAKGCPNGQDVANWKEAEAALLKSGA
jgi:hypothetical protein